MCGGGGGGENEEAVLFLSIDLLVALSFIGNLSMLPSLVVCGCRVQRNRWLMLACWKQGKVRLRELGLVSGRQVSSSCIRADAQLHEKQSAQNDYVV